MVAAGETPYAVLIGQAWRASLTRMLLLSLGLHVAVIMIVQPRPFPDVAEIVVIDARLSERTGDRPVPEVPSPPPPMTPAELPPSPLPQAVSRPEPAAVAEAERPAVAATPKPTAPSPQLEAPAVPPQPPAPRAEPAVAPSLPSVPVMIDTNWYEARQLDVQPAAARAISPRYPPDAARQGIEGTVKLRLRIDEYGVVKDAEVEEGDPPGVFDDSALEAFRQGQFRPARKDGRPVRALIYIRVRYELDQAR